METDAIKKFILQIPFFKAFTDHEPVSYTNLTLQTKA